MSHGDARDLLLTRQDALETSDLVGRADLSGVTGTPTFFVNGRRHYGSYDIASLSAAVRTAEAHGRLESLEARKARHPARCDARRHHSTCFAVSTARLPIARDRRSPPIAPGQGGPRDEGEQRVAQEDAEIRSRRDPERGQGVEA